MISDQILQFIKIMIDKVMIYGVQSQKTFPQTIKLDFIYFIDFI